MSGFTRRAAGEAAEPRNRFSRREPRPSPSTQPEPASSQPLRRTELDLNSCSAPDSCDSAITASALPSEPPSQRPAPRTPPPLGRFFKDKSVPELEPDRELGPSSGCLQVSEHPHPPSPRTAGKSQAARESGQPTCVLSGGSRVSILEELNGGVAADTVLLGQVRLLRGIDLCQSDLRAFGLQLPGRFGILRGQSLAVATPGGVWKESKRLTSTGRAPCLPPPGALHSLSILSAHQDNPSERTRLG